MAREYRQLWNEAGAIKGERYSEELSNYFKGIISLKKGMMRAENAEEQDNLYYTFELKENLYFYDELKNTLSELLIGALTELLRKNNYNKDSKILAVGLGNEKMTADSLGAITVSGLQITRHIIDSNPLKGFNNMPNLSAIKSSVSGVTGLNSFDIIKGVIERTKPDIVIAIDTLACKGVSRLGRAIQLSDEGIQPGGGVNNPKQKLSEYSLGVPVIAIGVPLVIYVRDIIRGYLENNSVRIKTDEFLHNLIVTAKEIDITVEEYGYLLSSVINQTLNRF